MQNPSTQSSTMQFRETLLIETDHPALPGHFPNRPLVPGVLLLDHVAVALQRWRGLRIARLVQVKFLQPLLPQQSAEILLEQRAARIAFEIRHGTQLIANGLVETIPIESDVDEPAT